MTKLRCLLLDDELPGLTYLKMLCEQKAELEVVKAFNNPTTFLNEIESLDFDLCFLDIEMPGLNGLHVARQLKNKMVIFITAYTDYAADAFDINAVDYIRKPVTKERLDQAVLKALATQKDKKEAPSVLKLNTDKGKTNLPIEQIIFIRTAETDSRDKKFYLTSGRTLNVKNISFDRLLELLPKSNFCRINKKELIAFKSIAYFSFDEVTLIMDNSSDEKVSLPLSEVYRKEFLLRYSD
jgi:DNA-binding LytR/AlgR family response regulator